MMAAQKSDKFSPLTIHRRDVLRLRQSDIAEKLGSAQAWVSQIERGAAKLQFGAERAKVADAYKLKQREFDMLFEATKQMFMPRKVINALNRRDEIDVFSIDKEGKGSPIPRWLNLAAGEGRDLELCPDYIYINDPRLPKKVHSAVIRGGSMLETLQEGDVILLQELQPNGRRPLPQIENKQEKMPFNSWRAASTIDDDDICVVSIEDDPPTLKRVKYDLSRGELRWKLQIVADNPEEWRNGLAFQAEVGDRVIFHAKLIGRAERLQ